MIADSILNLHQKKIISCNDEFVYSNVPSNGATAHIPSHGYSITEHSAIEEESAEQPVDHSMDSDAIITSQLRSCDNVDNRDT